MCLSPPQAPVLGGASGCAAQWGCTLSKQPQIRMKWSAVWMGSAPKGQLNSVECAIQAWHDVQRLVVSLVSSVSLCRVYRRLESIPTCHDEEEEKVAAELADLLGPERMPWLQLVHQLIVSEEVMQAEQ